MASPALCVLVVFCFIITRGNTSIKKFFGKVGDNVTFGPENVDSEITSFTWNRPEPSPLCIVAERDEGEEALLVRHPMFKNHVTVNFTTGYITLTSLKVGFSGTYTIRINTYSTDNQFILTVMNPVAKPQIKLDERTTNALFLKCDAAEKINWTSSTGKQFSPSSNGELTVEINTEDPDTCYTCTTYNEVSSSTSDFVCVKDFLPGIHGGVVAGIVLVVILVPLLLLLLFLLYIFYDPFRDAVKNRTGSCCTKVEGEGAQTEEQKANVPLNKNVSDNVENGEDQ